MKQCEPEKSERKQHTLKLWQTKVQEPIGEKHVARVMDANICLKHVQNEKFLSDPFKGAGKSPEVGTLPEFVAYAATETNGSTKERTQTKEKKHTGSYICSRNKASQNFVTFPILIFIITACTGSYTKYSYYPILKGNWSHFSDRVFMAILRALSILTNPRL